MGIAEFIIGPANGRTRWLHPSCRSVAAPLGHWPTAPRNLAAPIPPPRDPNGLRIVQLYPLFSRIYGQNRLETLRTSDVGTIDH